MGVRNIYYQVVVTPINDIFSINVITLWSNFIALALQAESIQRLYGTLGDMITQPFNVLGNQEVKNQRNEMYIEETSLLKTDTDARLR